GSDKQELADATAQQLRTGLVQILPYRSQGGFAHRRDALLVSLSDGTQNTPLELDVGEAQPAQLGDTQSGGVEELEHGAIPYAGRFGGVRGGKQALDFFSIQELRDGLPLPGRDQALRRIGADSAVGGQKTVEIAERRYVSGNRTGAKTVLMQRIQ